MQTTVDIKAVEDIMLTFAERTGLSNPDRPPRRYLWTDAHAVCTFLGLYDISGDETHLRLAVELVDQVHEVLGRHRDDDPRAGWISGLSDDEGLAHPTAGGLRIGKRLAERKPSEPIDERLEWDRDGQYFHYLTKWMHALCRAGAIVGEPRYGRWARELAKAAYAGFSVDSPGGRRLYWKMSIDLSYPLVASSGHHDPLDAYVTCHEISHLAGAGLEEELAGLVAMIAGRRWATADPLGIGGLLFDACRVVQLTTAAKMDGQDLAAALLSDAHESLRAYPGDSSLCLPAEHRLAFRELGMSIGLHAVDRMTSIVGSSADRFSERLRQELGSLRPFVPMAGAIEEFWCRAENQRVRSWTEHADINAVTLATSLLPDEFLSA